jgi:hypothetical protein
MQPCTPFEIEFAEKHPLIWAGHVLIYMQRVNHSERILGKDYIYPREEIAAAKAEFERLKGE